MWRQGNTPQQFGKNLGPITLLQGVELVEELLSRLGHVIRVPSSGNAVKGTPLFDGLDVETWHLPANGRFRHTRTD